MKIKELRNMLSEFEINSKIINLDGDISNGGSIVLYRNYDKWEIISVSDRGRQEIEKIFSNEDDACDYLFVEANKYYEMKIKNSKANKKTSISDSDDNLDEIIFL